MFNFADLAIWPFNQLINRTLELDPESLEKLTPLAGKVLAVEWRSLNITVYVYIHTSGVRLSFQHSAEPDTLLSSNTPFSMLRLLAQPNHPELSGEINVVGDVQFAQQIHIIFSGLAIDWEEQLAKFVGDGPASHAGKTAEGLKKAMRNMHSNMQENTKEFLQRETSHLPERAAVEDFLRNVDQLRNDVERAGARIKRLKES